MKEFENKKLRDMTKSDIKKVIDIVRVLEKKDSAHIMSRYQHDHKFSNNYCIGDYCTEEKSVKALFFPNTEAKENLKSFYNFMILKTENEGGYIRYHLIYTYDVKVKDKVIRTCEDSEQLDILNYYSYDEKKVYNEYQSSINGYQCQLKVLNTIRLNLKKDGSERKDKLKNIIYNLDGNLSNDKYIYSPILEYSMVDRCKFNIHSFGNDNYFSFNKSLDELTLNEILEEIEKDKKRLTVNINDLEDRKTRIKKEVAEYLEAKKQLDKYGRIKSILH